MVSVIVMGYILIPPEAATSEPTEPPPLLMSADYLELQQIIEKANPRKHDSYTRRRLRIGCCGGEEDPRREALAVCQSKLRYEVSRYKESGQASCQITIPIAFFYDMYDYAKQHYAVRDVGGAPHYLGPKKMCRCQMQLVLRW